jgi:hypothetical protein
VAIDVPLPAGLEAINPDMSGLIEAAPYLRCRRYNRRLEPRLCVRSRFSGVAGRVQRAVLCLAGWARDCPPLFRRRAASPGSRSRWHGNFVLLRARLCGAGRTL